MSIGTALAGITPPSQRAGAGRRIGDVIVELGFAERDLVEAAVAQARAAGKTTGQMLLESGAIDSRQLARAVAERYGLDYVDLNVFDVDKGAATLLDPGAARRYGVIPIAFLDEGTLLLATADPANVLALDDVAMLTGYDVRRAVTSSEDIGALIGRLGSLEEAVEEAGDQEEESAQVIELRGSAEEAPVVKLVHSIIADAVQRGASDIHFEPRRARPAASRLAGPRSSRPPRARCGRPEAGASWRCRARP